MRVLPLALEAANRARCRRQAPARPLYLAGQPGNLGPRQREASRKIDRFAWPSEEVTVSPPLSFERAEEPPVEKAALDAGQRAVADAPGELVGGILG